MNRHRNPSCRLQAVSFSLCSIWPVLMMIRPKRLLDHIGCTPQSHTKGWNNNQDFEIRWPTKTTRINDNWSKLTILPSIVTSRDQRVLTGEITRFQSLTGLQNTNGFTSYSQIREHWLEVKNSKYISQSVKDQIHEIYLDETTNHLNQLVFGGPDVNVISSCVEMEVKRPTNIDRGHVQGLCLVPKPPVNPRSPSTRRSRRTTKISATKKKMTCLSPVTESPRRP